MASDDRVTIKVKKNGSMQHTKENGASDSSGTPPQVSTNSGGQTVITLPAGARLIVD